MAITTYIVSGEYEAKFKREELLREKGGEVFIKYLNAREIELVHWL